MVAAADDWTKSAMRDGEVVAELLVSLKEARVRPALFTNRTVSALRWGIRQPRSRKETDSGKNSRCSPSTPLYWSGGCGGSSSSPSAYPDGYEATSRRITGSFPVGSTRSKDIASLRSGFSERGGTEKKNFKRMKLDTQISTSLSDGDLAENEDRNYLLPDLNVMPCEENGDHYSSMGVETTLYGIRFAR